MPAGIPKRNPARRNKSTTRATLTAAPTVECPPLLAAANENGWHPMTMLWWADVWASPMAPEYDPSDVHGLYLLAALVDSFWHHPSQVLAAEIRLQRQCYGLSPIDRRRLQWEIERSDEAVEKGQRRRTVASEAPAPTAKSDPRSVLRSVS